MPDDAHIQVAHITMLLGNGPRDASLTVESVAANYCALANPATFALITANENSRHA